MATSNKKRFQSVLGTMGSRTNQLAFSRDKSREQMLQTAIKSLSRRQRTNRQEAAAGLAASMADGILALKEEQKKKKRGYKYFCIIDLAKLGERNPIGLIRFVQSPSKWKCSNWRARWIS